MKHILSKIILFICTICTAMLCSVIVYADTPKILFTTDDAKKNAQINLNNVGIMIYSAQITFDMESDAQYTLIPNDSKAYSAVKTDNNKVTLYIDSTNLMDGRKDIELTFISSDKEMNVPNTAALTLIDRSMRSVTYDSVEVDISTSNIVTPKPTKRPSSGSGGGGGGGGSRRETSSPTPVQTTAPTKTPLETPSASAVPVPDNTNKITFKDVSPDYWAADVISYVTENGLFQGTSDTEFEPQSPMTRAMYVTVLKRFGEKIDPMFDIPCDNPAHFNDVDADTWYHDAVAWAGGIGIVNGIGDNKFAPSEPITREQIAVITINFASLCGIDLSEFSTVDAFEFTDSADISSWAANAVSTAQKTGLISGRENGVFAPQETATRAEVAAILQRFAEKVMLNQ